MIFLSLSLVLPSPLSKFKVKKINMCFILFIYLFLERGEGWEKERERNINWLPLIPPQLGTWPITQACALTGNQTGDLSVCRMMPTLLSHTSQGQCQLLSPIVLRPCLSFTSPPVHLHLRGLKWGRGEQH